MGDVVPVSREFLFDADTAVTAYHKLTRAAAPEPSANAGQTGQTGPATHPDPRARARPRPAFGFLLESVEGGEKWARYTFLGTAPREAWRLEAGGRVSRWSPGGGWSEATTVADPLAELDGLLRRRRPVPVPG
ncbi:MAG: hypothetical protein GWN07_29515, partial [Actinobacteria bacterium]|nr:hypothetical protein [Actinomycetota bacterium]NIS34769.1 hypothetical protein [Actinomycetota bacterium]NIU69520.1 hypothetical protein [Actinomycetota bacterium]NIW31389.1 hypothetical protein [Actinomycetota bacterium]NIX23738.1 hypothetical protein [Actinomycetota bacterium]